MNRSTDWQAKLLAVVLGLALLMVLAYAFELDWRIKHPADKALFLIF